MTFTLAQIQTSLLSRGLEELHTELGWSVVTTGLNAKLNDAMAWGLNHLGIEPTDFTVLVDDDFSAVTHDTLNELLDSAEYRQLQNIFRALTSVDVKIGHRTEEFSQLANRVGQAIDKMRTYIRKEYGIGRGTLDTGTIDLDITTDADDTIAETSTLT